MAINNARFDLYCAEHPVRPDSDWRDRGCIRIDAELGTSHGRTIPAAEQARLRRFTFTGVSPVKPKQSKEAAVRAKAAAGIEIPVEPSAAGGSKQKLLGSLNLIIGCNVMVTVNQQTQSGIVNGMLAEVVDIIMKPGAAVQFEHQPNCTTTGGGVHFVRAGQYIRSYYDIWIRSGVL